MGFFDKKRRDDDDDAPHHEVVPPVPAKAPPPPPPPPVPTPSTLAESARAAVTGDVHSVPPAKAPLLPPPPPIPPIPPLEATFGIEDAVQLMRTLPNRNIDLVMQVVKKTLESVRVDVSRIVEGATKKEQVIEERITTLRRDIDRLETQISQHKKEIAVLEADQKEVSTVKERLLLAQKVENEITSDRPPPTPKVSAAPGPAIPPPPPKA